MKNTALFYSGLVWLVAGVGVTVYASIGVLLQDIPGIEQLVTWLESLRGWWVLGATFISIVLEGLYFFGSFFPGTSIVVVLAVLSQVGSPWFFLLTLLTIYIGWIISGGINIWVAQRYGMTADESVSVHDRGWITWFPAFRANHEVAQVVAGAMPWRVFWSSVRVKTWATLGLGVFLLLLPLIIDIGSVENDEGFAGMYPFAVIMIGVGIHQMRQAYQLPTNNNVPD